MLDGAALAHPGIPDTRDGRVSFLLNDLLMRSQWVTIEEYADLLYVSARTLSNDMRLVEQKLAQFDLMLESALATESALRVGSHNGVCVWPHW